MFQQRLPCPPLLILLLLLVSSISYNTIHTLPSTHAFEIHPSLLLPHHHHHRHSGTVSVPSPSSALGSLQPSSSTANHINRMRRSSSSRLHATTKKKKKEPFRIAIIGGGWAGYTAAHTLSRATVPPSSPNDDDNDDDGEEGPREVSITLFDASPAAQSSSSSSSSSSSQDGTKGSTATTGGGLAGGYRNAKNRPVEAGIHGFWREYRNTFEIMEEVLVDTDDGGVESLDEILTDWTPTQLINKNGVVGVAPVLGNNNDSPTTTTTIPTPLSPLQSLPPPLPLALTPTLTTNPRLSPLDRLSGLGLLPSWIDFRQSSTPSWTYYDRLSASDLLSAAGVTAAIREELVDPLLAVLPMCPAEDCSAAGMLSCLHCFALQTVGAFDVRWCRGGIGEGMFGPWRGGLVGRGVGFREGVRVGRVRRGEDRRWGIDTQIYRNGTVVEGDDGGGEFDAVVMAVGGVAMGKIAADSPDLVSLPGDIPDFQKCRGITCVAVRLFLRGGRVVTAGLGGGGELDRTRLPVDMAGKMRDSPVVVCGPGISLSSVGGSGEAWSSRYLNETGFCIYDLQRLHTEFAVRSSSSSSSYSSSEEDEDLAVLEVDFYRADAIANLTNDQIIDLTLTAVAAALQTQKIPTKDVIDSAVVRARNAVSHFCVGSAAVSPGVRLGHHSTTNNNNNHNNHNHNNGATGIYMCGDWIDRTGHASWSTEKAVVTGRQAAVALVEDYDLVRGGGGGEGLLPEVREVAEDTAALEVMRNVADVLRETVPMEDGGAVTSPWVFVGRVLEKVVGSK